MPPSLNTTVPVRLVADPLGVALVPMVAVKVTNWVVFDGFDEETRVVVES